MAHGHSFSHVTTASVPPYQWYRLQSLLESWKSLLQDFPGYGGSDLTARKLENGDVRCQVRVSWLCLEQLEEFRESPWDTDRIMAAAECDLYDLSSETFEHFI